MQYLWILERALSFTALCPNYRESAKEDEIWRFYAKNVVSCENNCLKAIYGFHGSKKAKK